MIDFQLIENFLPDVDIIRQHALSSKFIDWEGPDGQLYKRVCITEVPGLHNAIERAVGPVDVLGMGYRLNYAGELPNQSIHSDVGWGTHALVLYLGDGESGTGFWRHRATGASRLVDGDIELLQKIENDWGKPDRWTLHNFVGMRKNRAIIYSSELFHSRWPFEAFGDSPETGRLIAVAFFSKRQDMIRQATIEDLSSIMEMADKFYQNTHYKGIAEFDYNAVAYLSKILIETGVVLVAESDGKLVGVVGLILVPFMFNPSKIGAHEIIWWVDPKHQGSGIGMELLKAVEPACLEMKADYIQMALLPNSPPKAETLYRVLGYNHSETAYTKVL